MDRMFVCPFARTRLPIVFPHHEGLTSSPRSECVYDPFVRVMVVIKDAFFIVEASRLTPAVPNGAAGVINEEETARWRKEGDGHKDALRVTIFPHGILELMLWLERERTRYRDPLLGREAFTAFENFAEVMVRDAARARERVDRVLSSPRGHVTDEIIAEWDMIALDMTGAVVLPFAPWLHEAGFRLISASANARQGDMPSMRSALEQTAAALRMPRILFKLNHCTMAVTRAKADEKPLPQSLRTGLEGILNDMWRELKVMEHSLLSPLTNQASGERFRRGMVELEHAARSVDPVQSGSLEPKDVEELQSRLREIGETLSSPL